ncbi:MAG TPA: two-component regulator propeller domain-containing protein, partial [Prolixibacteraceae bacterium]
MKRGKLKKLLLFYLFSILISTNSIGQTKTFEFDHYTTNDGLSNGYINSIMQDSKGFIWICTSNGLNRFDGISFKSYYINLKDSTTIPGNGVSSLTEDSLGNIWVMTNSDL